MLFVSDAVGYWAGRATSTKYAKGSIADGDDSTWCTSSAVGGSEAVFLGFMIEIGAGLMPAVAEGES